MKGRGESVLLSEQSPLGVYLSWSVWQSRKGSSAASSKQTSPGRAAVGPGAHELMRGKKWGDWSVKCWASLQMALWCKPSLTVCDVHSSPAYKRTYTCFVCKQLHRFYNSHVEKNFWSRSSVKKTKFKLLEDHICRNICSLDLSASNPAIWTSGWNIVIICNPSR